MESFERDLTAVLNRHNKDTQCGMPDFILTDFLIGCLKALERANDSHREWQGHR